MSAENEATSALLGLSNSLADAVERVGRSVVGVAARNHVPSSGVYWRDGVVVTADHTIERDEGITIILPNGETTQASVAGRDSGTDLAVLKVQNGSLAAVDRAEPGTARVGHIVIAVARPGDSGLSASWGAVSSVGGPYRTWSGGNIDQLIRPDLTLYPGFSGGPLVDARGQVIGINTSGLSRSMTVAIPVATVSRVVDQLLTKGRIARGFLGLGMQPVRLPDSIRTAGGLGSEHGLIVVSVEPNGPAEKAGILLGDIVVALDGQPVGDTRDVQRALDPEKIGQEIPVKLVRGGSLQEVALTIGERPGGE